MKIWQLDKSKKYSYVLKSWALEVHWNGTNWVTQELTYPGRYDWNVLEGLEFTEIEEEDKKPEKKKLYAHQDRESGLTIFTNCYMAGGYKIDGFNYNRAPEYDLEFGDER